MTRILTLGVLSLICGIMSLGCDKSSEVADLEGTVTYDGQTVDAGAIVLISTGEKGRSGGGSIVDGKIVMNPENRTPPGTYKVQLRWSKKTGKQFKTESGEMLDDRKEALPEKYHEKSELTITLKPGKNVENFDLPK